MYLYRFLISLRNLRHFMDLFVLDEGYEKATVCNTCGFNSDLCIREGRDSIPVEIPDPKANEKMVYGEHQRYLIWLTKDHGSFRKLKIPIIRGSGRLNGLTTQSLKMILIFAC
ncbi:hypothetical protein C5167_031114 [Papaver somniferum]|nr:hypothetical protein C5167_031114 [Papaver somniferum]